MVLVLVQGHALCSVAIVACGLWDVEPPFEQTLLCSAIGDRQGALLLLLLLLLKLLFTHLKAYVAMLRPSIELCVAVNVINGRHMMCNQRCDFLTGLHIYLVLATAIVLRMRQHEKGEAPKFSQINYTHTHIYYTHKYNSSKN